jgi:hypothetical protein
MAPCQGPLHQPAFNTLGDKTRPRIGHQRQKTCSPQRAQISHNKTILLPSSLQRFSNNSALTKNQDLFFAFLSLFKAKLPLTHIFFSFARVAPSPHSLFSHLHFSSSSFYITTRAFPNSPPTSHRCRRGNHNRPYLTIPFGSFQKTLRRLSLSLIHTHTLLLFEHNLLRESTNKILVYTGSRIDQTQCSPRSSQPLRWHWQPRPSSLPRHLLSVTLRRKVGNPLETKPWLFHQAVD